MNMNINIEDEQNMSNILIFSVPIEDQEKTLPKVFYFHNSLWYHKRFYDKMP